MKKTLLILPLIVFLSVVSLAQQRNEPGSPLPERILKFYPNPATSFINFDFQKGYDKGYTIQVFNFIGKQVSEVKNVTPKTTLNISEYNRGIYIYQLKDMNGKLIESGKFQVAK